MSKKPIVVFEGIEGSGKSHHISVVSKYLDKKKFRSLKLENQEEILMLKKLEKINIKQKFKF